MCWCAIRTSWSFQRQRRRPNWNCRRLLSRKRKLGEPSGRKSHDVCREAIWWCRRQHRHDDDVSFGAVNRIVLPLAMFLSTASVTSSVSLFWLWTPYKFSFLRAATASATAADAPPSLVAAAVALPWGVSPARKSFRSCSLSARDSLPDFTRCCCWLYERTAVPPVYSLATTSFAVKVKHFCCSASSSRDGQWNRPEDRERKKHHFSSDTARSRFSKH